MLRYSEGNILTTTTTGKNGTKLILSLCSIDGTWSNEFLDIRWKYPRDSYKDWFEKKFSNNFKLGSVQNIQVEDDVYVINMVVGKTNKEKWRVYSEAFQDCLFQIYKFASKFDRTSIHVKKQGLRFKYIEDQLFSYFKETDIDVVIYN